jgi:microcystin-dependent protein
MAKNGLYQYSATPANNTDVAGINIAEGCAPANINNAIRQVMADIAQWLNTGLYQTDTGAVNALVITLNPAPLAMTALIGVPLTIVPAYTNTGAATVNFNGLGAVPITTPAKGPLGAGALVAGSVFQAVYDGTELLLLSTNSGLLVGEIKEWPSNTLPPLYVWANGGALSRTTYAALFVAYGTTFGAGDGSTTFNVIDKRGRVAAGADAMGGAAAANRLTTASLGVAAALGAVGGNELLHSHNHTAVSTDSGHAHTVPGQLGGSGLNINSGSQTNLLSNGTSGTGYANITTTVYNSGGGSSQNVQPTVVTNFIIYAGV